MDPTRRATGAGSSTLIISSGTVPLPRSSTAPQEYHRAIPTVSTISPRRHSIKLCETDQDPFLQDDLLALQPHDGDQAQGRDDLRRSEHGQAVADLPNARFLEKHRRTEHAQPKQVTRHARTSSLRNLQNASFEHDHVRTASANSTATGSTGSSDFPVTPTPPVRIVVPKSQAWSAGVPVLSEPLARSPSASPTRTKGPNMTDPRFSPRHHLSPTLARDPAPSGSVQPSFVANLGSTPLLGPEGVKLPLFPPSDSDPKTVPSEPPSPFAPTSPVDPTFPHSRESELSPKRSTTTPTTAQRRQSPKRKPVTRIPRRHSAHRRARSASSGSSSSNPNHPNRRYRYPLRRAKSVPPATSIPSTSRYVVGPVPINFELLVPRDPKTRQPQAQGSARNGGRRRQEKQVPSTIVDELVGVSRNTEGDLARIEKDPVFPSRTTSKQPGASSTRRKEKKKAIDSDTTPATLRQRKNQSWVELDSKKSLFLPRPRLVLSSGSEHGGSEPDQDRQTTIEGHDQDQSSVLRVLWENEEFERERQGWSDSAVKTLAQNHRLGNIGLGFSLDKKMSLRARNRREERKRVRKEIEASKRRSALDSGTEGETTATTAAVPRRPRAMPQLHEYSPPLPHSFEPFTSHLLHGKKLSLSLTRSRDEVDASLPRTVRGKPIRHLRTSPSVDSIFPRGSSSYVPLSLQDSARTASTQYGQALSIDDPDTTLLITTEHHRRPSLPNQNAFLSLPPHLHHLLRSPQAEPYEPSRAPPPVPVTWVDPAERPHSERWSTGSVASATRWSHALESRLNSISTGRVPLSIHQIPTTEAPTSAELNSKLSPLPEVASPHSQDSFNSHSDSSEGFNMDVNGNWNDLFFSPPRRQEPPRRSGDPSVLEAPLSILVASEDEDEEATTDTEGTFNLELTRRSLEALFPSSDRPIATNLFPPLVRNATEQSSAQASFVTAREVPENSTARTVGTRPLATPAQTPWASTSFAREYLDSLAEDDQETIVDTQRTSSRISNISYIDFDGPDECNPDRGEEAMRRRSPVSFLEDFSPSSSVPASPVVMHTTSSHAADNRSFTFEIPSLPTSPTLSSTYGEPPTSSRMSFRGDVPTMIKRASHLSVGSHNLRISPTAAKFVNMEGGASTRSYSFQSSKSAMLSSFPIPPSTVDEDGRFEDAGSDGDDEGDDGKEESSISFEQNNQASPHRTVETSRSPISFTKIPPAGPGSDRSFLDVSDASENETSKRWSRQTFQTFYSNPKAPIPPVPSFPSRP
ncbi:uncharacterized protein JCM15063_000757 [Sporobolomyces koalae]|uniref:uncharacterized protein n=1 Tax=Sporobolomyces koalae TaxID=500713 RepID=UPI00316B7C57